MKTKLKACLFCLLVPVLLQGQEIGVLRMNLDTVGFKGTAAIRGGVEEGGFRPIHAASFQWTAGAEAKVVNHGEHSSWTGALSFDQMMGQYKNGNGYSMLLDPDYFPLDIVEFSPGTKSRQSFSLEGGFLTDFGYDWAAGVKASVQGAYTSKRREIPHKDLALTVQLEPTLTFVMDEDMGLVSTYIARFRTENLKADAAGADGNETPIWRTAPSKFRNSRTACPSFCTIPSSPWGWRCSGSAVRRATDASNIPEARFRLSTSRPSRRKLRTTSSTCPISASVTS